MAQTKTRYRGKTQRRRSRATHTNPHEDTFWYEVWAEVPDASEAEENFVRQLYQDGERNVKEAISKLREDREDREAAIGDIDDDWVKCLCGGGPSGDFVCTCYPEDWAN